MKLKIIALALTLIGGGHLFAQLQFNQYMLGAMRARQIGPAVMGGRISDLAISNLEPEIMYVGAAGGGVWKSANGGVSFTPIFDDHVQSIGALGIDHARPDTLWVGTGESWVRNSVSIGKGLYRTTDGGKTWSVMGFETSERIARIAVHPTDPNIVYVAVLGALFNDSEERGLYKTTDFGKSWKKVLYTNEKAGCADVVISATDPEVVLAAMWEMRRTAWSFNSGGPGSGLYISTNDGDEFTKCEGGLPTESVGRIAIDISQTDSDVMYANVESSNTAMYKSVDQGETWKQVNKGSASTLRPFYFSRITLDPHNHNIVYKTSLNLFKSEDGGETFSEIFGSAHSDHHALWIDPRNSNHIVTCTDGGLYQSFDKGKAGRFINSLPISQYYHVTTDMATPYKVYGGLQDNGSWMGPNSLDRPVANHDWKFVGGGDGFHVVSSPSKPELVFWEYQGGNMYRTNMITEEAKSIRPPDPSTSQKLRFNWNTPIILGKANSNNLYVGSQFLHFSTDNGDSWKTISPDLTTNDSTKLQQSENGGATLDNSSAENHCTIFSIAESPLDQGTIWVGTDDGNLQLTEDGGASWKNVVDNIKGAPKNSWISSIQPSRFNKQVCYVTLDAHMMGDMATYVFRTSDNGQTFKQLTSTEFDGYAHVILEDSKQQDLLFLGTEFGLFFSFDAGQTWLPFRNEVPKVSIRDAVIQERDNDLVLATHGRGVIILDNIDVLRELASGNFDKSVTIISPKPAIRRLGGLGGWFGDDGQFNGVSEDRSARVWYVLNDRHLKGKFTILVKDPSGETLRKIPASTRKGLNSVEIPLRMPAPLTATSEVAMAGGTFAGPLLQEGSYTLEFNKNGEIYTTGFDVTTDTIYAHSVEDRKSQQTLVWQLYTLNEELAVTSTRIQNTLSELNALDTLKLSGSTAEAFNAVRVKLDSLNKSIVNTVRGFVTGEEQLREELASLYGEINGYMGRPTVSQFVKAEMLTKRVKDATRKTEETLASPLSNLAIGVKQAEAGKLTSEERQQTFGRMRKP